VCWCFWKTDENAHSVDNFDIGVATEKSASETSLLGWNEPVRVQGGLAIWWTSRHFYISPAVSCRYAPQPMNHEYCETKRNLLRAWQDKSEAYSKGLGELVEKVGRIRPSEYKQAHVEVEILRQSFVEARTTYEGHVVEHEC
jgi:hypothetical protein